MKNTVHKIARDGFLDYILTKKPEYSDFIKADVWRKHIAVIEGRCHFFNDFFDAAEYLKQKNFDGFIFDANCRKYSNRTEINIYKVI